MEQANPADILKAYEHLAEVTARMRAAAAQEDWDGVVALESECSDVYERLVRIERETAADPAYQKRKSELICKLLEDDAHIRERLSGQLTHIWRMIDGRHTVDRLSSAYGAGAGPAEA
jgi:flagellar protein FliT